MHVHPYLDSLATDLLTAARVGGPDVEAAAERLVPALGPASRLMVLELLAQASAEITAALPDTVVEVRLSGRDPELVTTSSPPPPGDQATPPEAPEETSADEDATVSRVTVRMPESVKTLAERRAQEAGQSLNTWIVHALREASGSSPRGRATPGGRTLHGWV